MLWCPRRKIAGKSRNNSQVVVVESDEGLYETEYDAILAGVDQGVGSYELIVMISLLPRQEKLTKEFTRQESSE